MLSVVFGIFKMLKSLLLLTFKKKLVFWKFQNTKIPIKIPIMNKIIFLDIDGVLNPQHYMNCLHKMWKASSTEIKSQDDFGDLFFQHNCDALQMIVDATGADIVISSTWRLAGGMKMKELWMHRKLAGKIIGITPTEVEVVKSGKAEFYDAVCRGMEIAHWIDTNNFKGNYVIIDDTEDMLQLQEPFFVKTNSWVGLTFKDAKKAIEILGVK